MTAVRVLLFLLFLPCLCSAQADNPFTAPPPGKKEAPARVRQTRYPEAVQKLFFHVSRTQRTLHVRLSAFARRIKASPSPGLIAALVGLAFCFGVVHAVGPGHGKMFTVSYLLTESASIRNGLLFGNCFAFVHAGSAVLLVLLLYYLFRQTVFTSVENLSYYIRLVSYTLIALIGAGLLLHNIRRRCASGGQPLQRGALSRSPLLMALSVGIVPCTGTVILMLFFISLEMLTFGILVSLSMALGMAVTISAIGLTAVFSRKGIEASFSGTKKAGTVVSAVFEIGGAFAIFCMGSFLLFVSSA